MKALDAASVAAIEAQLKAAANGDISIEDALAAANAAALSTPSHGHPWLHPRKGWRNNTKSGGKANRRRKLKPGFLAKAMELRPVRQRSAVATLDIETRADL
jgi:hypothetical protein